MKIYFDTEFIENGKTIDLLSVGLVREDGSELYLESIDCNRSKASEWVVENVFPHLRGHPHERRRFEIAREVLLFAGDEPEFWAYYADYDWVALCQLYGRMIDLPKAWPMFCRDLKQALDGVPEAEIPKQAGTEHHALADARWVRQTHLWLQNPAGRR
jgi:hypothetical protein